MKPPDRDSLAKSFVGHFPYTQGVLPYMLINYVLFTVLDVFAAGHGKFIHYQTMNIRHLSLVNNKVNSNWLMKQ